MSHNKYILNSFQTPNTLVDDLMHLLDGNECKILLFTIRHIYGWQDKIKRGKAHISLTMYEKGFSGMHGVGLSRPTIINIINELVKYRLLVKVGKATNRGQAFSIGIDPDIDGLIARQTEKYNKDKQRLTIVKNSGKATLPVKPLNYNQLSDLTTGGKATLPKQTQDKTQDKTQYMSSTSDDDGINHSTRIENHAQEDTKPKDKPRKRDDVFDIIASEIFNISTGMITKSNGGRIAKCKKALQEIHDLNNTELTAGHLRYFMKWYSKSYQDQILPKAHNKLAEYYTEFYSWAKTQTSSSIQPIPAYDDLSWINELPKEDYYV